MLITLRTIIHLLNFDGNNAPNLSQVILDAANKL